MKKLCIFLLLLSLLLSSCTSTVKNESNTGDTEPPKDTVREETEDIENTPDEQPEPVDDDAYKSIERRRAENYEADYYGFENDSELLNIASPKEWILKDSDEGFDIVRDGQVIGYLIGYNSYDTDEWKVLESESHSVNDVYVSKFIERKNGTADFRYRYVYTYSTDGRSHTVTLAVDCAEVDGKTEERLYTYVFTLEKLRSETVGMLSDEVGDPSSVLILGNSFVGTSKIGDILREMIELNGKSSKVGAISIGNAQVGTYSNDISLLQTIREGRYDAVFICGFYSYPQVANLGMIKSACDSSETTLVIFPAHNESASVIAAAREAYPTLHCLNWKGELEGLIKRGVDIWDLCISDAYNHSRPLAGYVGAHMIYRAIYNELPSKPMRYTIKQTYVDGILERYAYVADAQIIKEDDITYLD